MSQNVSRCFKISQDVSRLSENMKSARQSATVNARLVSFTSKAARSSVAALGFDRQEECFQSRIVPWKYIERPAPHFWAFFQLWKGLNAAAVAITCLLNPVLRFPLGHWGTNTAVESFTSPDLGHSIAAKVSENTMTSNHLIPSGGQQKPTTQLLEMQPTQSSPQALELRMNLVWKVTTASKALDSKVLSVLCERKNSDPKGIDSKLCERKNKKTLAFESFWILLAPIHCCHCRFNWSQTKKDKQELGKIYVLFQRKEKLDLFTISMFQ